VLVLSRKSGERIVIGPNIELSVVDIGKARVRVAIDVTRRRKSRSAARKYINEFKTNVTAR
jgi:carbon storage regulator CsrA